MKNVMRHSEDGLSITERTDGLYCVSDRYGRQSMPLPKVDSWKPVKEKGKNIYIAVDESGKKIASQRISNRYQVVEFVGSGGSSLCYKGFEEDDGHIVIIKEFYPIHLAEDGLIRRSDFKIYAADSSKKDSVKEAFLRGFSQETDSGDTIRFTEDEDNGINNDPYFLTGTLIPYEGDDELNRYAVIDTHGGTLLKDISFESSGRKRVIDELALGMQIAIALNALHKKNRIHLDLKPQNILVSSVDTHADDKGWGGHPAILIDFGSSFPVDDEGHIDRTDDDMLFSSTWAYAAPEVINALKFGNYSGIGLHSDVYSLFVILRDLLLSDVSKTNTDEAMASKNIFRSNSVGTLTEEERTMLNSFLSKGLVKRSICSVDAVIKELGTIIDVLHNKGVHPVIMKNRAMSTAQGFEIDNKTIDHDLLPKIRFDGKIYDSLLSAIDVLPNWFTLVGEGGAGKSTLLKSSFVELTKKHDIIPVWIDASVADREDYVIEAINREYTGSTANREDLVKLFQTDDCRFFIFVDGVNESSHTAEVLKGIKKLPSCENLMICVSSRIVHREMQSYPVVIVMPLDDDLIKNKTGACYGLKNAKLRTLLSRPMYLSLWLRNKNTQARNASELMRYELDRLVRMQEENGKNATRSAFLSDTFTFYLPKLLFDSGVSLSTEDLMDKLWKAYDASFSDVKVLSRLRNKEYIKNPNQAFSEVTDLLAGCGLLQEHEGYYHIHEDWHKYFVSMAYAEEIKNHNPDILGETILPHDILESIGEILDEAAFAGKSDWQEPPSPMERYLRLFTGLHAKSFRASSKVRTAIHNSVEIMKVARNNAITADYSQLDLSLVSFVDCTLPNSNFIDIYSGDLWDDNPPFLPQLPYYDAKYISNVSVSPDGKSIFYVYSNPHDDRVNFFIFNCNDSCSYYEDFDSDSIECVFSEDSKYICIFSKASNDFEDESVDGLRVLCLNHFTEVYSDRNALLYASPVFLGSHLYYVDAEKNAMMEISIGNAKHINKNTLIAGDYSLKFDSCNAIVPVHGEGLLIFSNDSSEVSLADIYAHRLKILRTEAFYEGAKGYKLSPDNRHLAFTTGYNLNVYDISTGKCVRFSGLDCNLKKEPLCRQYGWGGDYSFLKNDIAVDPDYLYYIDFCQRIPGATEYSVHSWGPHGDSDYCSCKEIVESFFRFDNSSIFPSSMSHYETDFLPGMKTPSRIKVISHMDRSEITLVQDKMNKNLTYDAHGFRLCSCTPSDNGDGDGFISFDELKKIFPEQTFSLSEVEQGVYSLDSDEDFTLYQNRRGASSASGTEFEDVPDDCQFDGIFIDNDDFLRIICGHSRYYDSLSYYWLYDPDDYLTAYRLMSCPFFTPTIHYRDTFNNSIGFIYIDEDGNAVSDSILLFSCDISGSLFGGDMRGRTHVIKENGGIIIDGHEVQESLNQPHLKSIIMNNWN